jgi:hypothetical protein
MEFIGQPRRRGNPILGTATSGDNMRSSDESVTLISAGKVQRTPVYSERAELLGESMT